MDIDYRIIIPVTTQAHRLERLAAGITDKSKLIVVHNYNHKETIKVGKKLKKMGAEIIPFEGDNRGSCASWNIGLRKLDTTPAQFLVILSPGTQFPNGADEFINAIINTEKTNPTLLYGIKEDGFHSVCLTKRLHDAVGFFDENLYPCYRDDADWQRRQSLLPDFTETRFLIEIEQTLGTGTRNNYIFAHYWYNNLAQIVYYTQKWGEDVGLETFTLPFNDKPLNYWEPNKTSQIRLSEITKAMADDWIGKRSLPGGSLLDGGDKDYE